MKIVTLIVGLVALTSGALKAQNVRESELPEAVKKAFTQKFPDVKEVKWSKEGATEFEAEFEINKRAQSANFDTKGKWLVTETEIRKSDLPPSVQVTIEKEFPGYKIEEAEKAESWDNGSFYEVELKNGKLKYEIQLTADGKVIKKAN